LGTSCAKTNTGSAAIATMENILKGKSMNLM
jgi:hypothetical protein